MALTERGPFGRRWWSLGAEAAGIDRRGVYRLLRRIALTAKDGKLKAIVYNFACHEANEREPVISADFPGDVEPYVRRQLG